MNACGLQCRAVDALVLPCDSVEPSPLVASSAAPRSGRWIVPQSDEASAEPSPHRWNRLVIRSADARAVLPARCGRSDGRVVSDRGPNASGRSSAARGRAVQSGSGDTFRCRAPAEAGTAQRSPVRTSMPVTARRSHPRRAARRASVFVDDEPARKARGAERRGARPLRSFPRSKRRWISCCTSPDKEPRFSSGRTRSPAARRPVVERQRLRGELVVTGSQDQLTRRVIAMPLVCAP